MFWSRSRGRDEEQIAKLYKSCRSSLDALTGCLRANPGDAGAACANLETTSMMCLAKGLPAAKSAHSDFLKCISDAHARSARLGRLVLYADEQRCRQEREALQRCLQRAKLWPPPASGR